MRKLVIVIVALAVAWAITPVRQRITAGALPLVEKLGPVGDALATPMRRFSAKNQTKHLLRLITEAYNEGRPVPDERSFQSWLARRAPETEAHDPWGRPYWLSRGRGTLTVGSDGEDGTRGTADDVKHSVPF